MVLWKESQLWHLALFLFHGENINDEIRFWKNENSFVYLYEFKINPSEQIYNALIFILNNEEGVTNQKLSANIGCCIEEQIAHMKSDTWDKILNYQNYLNQLDRHFNRINGLI
jgi:hypothetical protein